MKRYFTLLSGALTYIVLALILSGYGNIKVHRAINQSLVEGFGKKFLDGIFTLNKFRNYTIVFDGTLGLTGPAITTGGYLSAAETNQSNNFKKWLIEGGYSADEPELPASFRHFYDPTEPEGQRYLKDHLDYLTAKLHIGFNPKIDQIDWAIKNAEHAYNWNNGKDFFKKALETSDLDKRNEYMAKAYRSLGETLHMIADMGCPAHVRDDSHPAPFEEYGVLAYFGSPDPYEENFESMVSDISGWGQGTVDGTLKDYFRSSTTVEAIAKKMAQYTNQNFFTNQTISGTDVIPQIHPEKTYSLPKLDNCNYDPLTHTFQATVGGSSVAMCKDLSYFWKLIPNRGYPYIDIECVRSQGAVLIPQIVEAGANAIRLFIPSMVVEIQSFSNDSVIGVITHMKDNEYTSEIKYNGVVEIIRTSDLAKVGEGVAKDGKFGAPVIINVGDKLIARIKFGDITVKSEEFIPQLKSKVYNKTKKTWYTIIQKAIDDAGNKDSLLVYPGVYKEYLSVNNKSLVILGNAGSATTILEGENGGTAFRVNNCSPTISGFTMHKYNTGIMIWETGTNTTIKPIIENNLIKDNTDKGIYVSGRAAPQVLNNVFSNTGYYGVDFDKYYAIRGDAVPLISGNSISGCNRGIRIDGDIAVDVISNKFTGNEWGIEVLGLSSVTLSKDTITGSTSAGIRLYLVQNACLVSKCVIKQNQIGINSRSSAKHVFSGNDILNNQYGIIAENGNNPTGEIDVSQNKISGNLQGISLSVDKFSIKGNTVTNNTGSGGIEIRGTCTGEVSSNTVSGNSSTYGGGIFVYSKGAVTIKQNIISKNKATEYGGGIYSTSGTDVTNPSIIGNTISENYAGSKGGGIYGIGNGWAKTAVVTVSKKPVTVTRYVPCFDESSNAYSGNSHGNKAGEWGPGEDKWCTDAGYDVYIN